MAANLDLFCKHLHGQPNVHKHKIRLPLHMKKHTPCENGEENGE